MVGLVGHRGGDRADSRPLAWSGEIWFAPYALFWLWVIIVCIQLSRRTSQALLTEGTDVAVIMRTQALWSHHFEMP